MKNRIVIMILAAALVMLSSCRLQKLEEDYSVSAKLPISVDWTTSGITPQNVTVLFYDENNNGNLVMEHTFQNNDNAVQSYANVPIGKYTVVIFNELRDEVENVGVRGYESLATLEFYPTTDVVARVRADGDLYTKQPGKLATAVIRNFEVTLDMLKYTTSDVSTRSEADPKVKSAVETLVGVIPQNKVCYLNITLHIKGLHNARMPALVDLRNVAAGYFAGSDINSSAFATKQFTLSNRLYDEGSNRDGSISTKLEPISLFGVIGNRLTTLDQPATNRIMLDILFMLVDKDKTIINRVVDITNLISFADSANGTISLTLDIDISPKLPDVLPEGSSDSDFGSKLEDWDLINVPLINK